MQGEPSDKNKQLYDPLLPQGPSRHFPEESLKNGGSGTLDEETRHKKKKKKMVRYSQPEHEEKLSPHNIDDPSSADSYNRRSPSLNKYALWAAVLASTNSVLLGYGELTDPS